MTHKVDFVSDGKRFALAGVGNTLLTLALYQLLLFVTPPVIAYACSWIVGMVIVFLVYPKRVFPGSERNLRARLGILAGYLVGFGVGIFIVRLSSFTGAERIGVFLAIASSALVSFLLTRLAARSGLISNSN